MNDVLFGLAMFVTAAVTDWLWAHYTMATASRRAGPAALWAAAIILAGLVSLNALLTSYWYVIPLASGSAAGTYLAVVRSPTRQEDHGDSRQAG